MSQYFSWREYDEDFSTTFDDVEQSDREILTAQALVQAIDKWLEREGINEQA